MLSQLGREFENKIHDFLLKTNSPILREKEIVRKYGKITNGIDHLVYGGYHNNILIAIQDKWTSSSPQLSAINHFIRCVKCLEKIEQKNVIAIFVTKKNITKGAKESFDFENNTLRRFFVVDDENIEQIKYKLAEILHYHNTFLYEFDGSAIMLKNKLS